MEAPEKIYHVSQTQLSIARYYGGCSFNGHGYTYNPVDDTLTRNDVLKGEIKTKKQLAKAEKERILNSMPDWIGFK